MNILIIFVLSGLWHGANWTFILWGFVHGVFNILNRYCDKWWNKVHSALKWMVNFVFINFTWVIFRGNSMRDVASFFKRILTLDFTYNFNSIYVIILAIALFVVLAFKSITNKDFKVNWQRIVVGSILFIASLLLINSSAITFLYSNF